MCLKFCITNVVFFFFFSFGIFLLQIIHYYLKLHMKNSYSKLHVLWLISSLFPKRYGNQHQYLHWYLHVLGSSLWRRISTSKIFCIYKKERRKKKRVGKTRKVKRTKEIGIFKILIKRLLTILINLNGFRFSSIYQTPRLEPNQNNIRFGIYKPSNHILFWNPTQTAYSHLVQRGSALVLNQTNWYTLPISLLCIVNL